jgi:hypothetical protein
MSTENSLSREDKLKFIGFPADYKKDTLTDDIVDDIYNKVSEAMNNKNNNKPTNITPKGTTHIKKSKHPKVDNDSGEYKVTLAFLNGLLKQMKKPEITDITQFKDILRTELTKPECEQILNNHIDNIIKQFGKSKIRYHMKDQYDYYVITVIKYLTRLCGYEFASHNTQSFKKVENRDYKFEFSVYYSIA